MIILMLLRWHSNKMILRLAQCYTYRFVFAAVIGSDSNDVL